MQVIVTTPASPDIENNIESSPDLAQIRSLHSLENISESLAQFIGRATNTFGKLFFDKFFDLTPTLKLPTLLMAVALVKNGQQILKEVGQNISFNYSNVSLVFSDCKITLPPGSADLLSPSRITQFISAAPITNSIVWLQELLDRNSVIDRPLVNWSSDNSYSAMTFNLLGLPQILSSGMGLSRFGVENKRYQNILNALRAMPSDIIGLQECWCPSTARIISQSNYPYVAGQSNCGKFFFKSGLVTLSKYPIIEEEFFPFSASSGVEYFVKKGALRTRIHIPNHGEVDVYNVHLASEPERANQLFINRFSADSIRLKQIDELKSFIQKRLDPHRPIILLGDLNIDEADTESYQKCLQICPWDTYRLRQGEIGLAFNPDGTEKRKGVTYDPENNKMAKAISRLGERLDYILYKPSSGQNPLISSERLYKDTPISDHYAVRTNFRFIR